VPTLRPAHRARELASIEASAFIGKAQPQKKPTQVGLTFSSFYGKLSPSKGAFYATDLYIEADCQR
jgi:hypothetical protein